MVEERELTDIGREVIAASKRLREQIITALEVFDERLEGIAIFHLGSGSHAIADAVVGRALDYLGFSAGSPLWNLILEAVIEDTDGSQDQL